MDFFFEVGKTFFGTEKAFLKLTIPGKLHIFENINFPLCYRPLTPSTNFKLFTLLFEIFRAIYYTCYRR